MTRFLVGTDDAATSEAIATYLNGTIDADDEVYVINSLVGGDETSGKQVSQGEDAIDAFEETIDVEPVESHQYVRGNHPIEDIVQCVEEWDIEELVIGIRKRSPVGKMVFGSTAQNVLLEAEVPVRCVPLVSN